MNQQEKIAFGAGAVIGGLITGSLMVQNKKLYEELKRQKIDNIRLLALTFRSLDSVINQRELSPDDVADLEFRRMAFMSEFEGVEEMGNDNDA